MRGGVSYICKSCSKASNKYFKSYSKQESKHIFYLDANNLHGYAMSKFPPTGKFKWVEAEDFDVNKCNKNSSKSCVLEGDLEYPKALCELHNDYPLAPNKIEIKREMVSKY